MQKNKEQVVLLHGLFRSASSMKKLEKFLLAEGYEVFNIDYTSTSGDIKSIALNVALQIKEAIDFSRSDKVHFVTHSLGGIVLRYIVQEGLLPMPGNVVMIAPPNHGATISDKMPRWKWLEKLLGSACFELGTDALSVPNQLKHFNAPLGIIAGSSSANPFWALITPKPNDSTVMVESTKLPEMLDHLEVPFVHSFLMNKKIVISQVAYFLQHRFFQR